MQRTPPAARLTLAVRHHVEADDLVAEGDKVAVRSHFTGTHTGEFQGVPPTGKHVKVDSFDMFRIAGGKFV